MAKVYMNGVSLGDVLTSDKQQEYPCMDTNYREMTWTFVTLKQFSDFEAMIAYEKNTIPTYFSDREKDVSYATDIENDCILQTAKRKSILTPGADPDLPCYAEFEYVFTKED